MEVDTFYRSSKAGDRFMLCSDGLSDLVSNDDIEEVMAGISGCEATSEALVSRALGAGGVDNITVLVVDVLPEDD